RDAAARCASEWRQVLRHAHGLPPEADLREPRLAARDAQGDATDRRLLRRRVGRVHALRRCVVGALVPESAVKVVAALVLAAGLAAFSAPSAGAANECRGLPLCVRAAGPRVGLAAGPKPPRSP